MRCRWPTPARWPWVPRGRSPAHVAAPGRALAARRGRHHHHGAPPSRSAQRLLLGLVEAAGGRPPLSTPARPTCATTSSSVSRKRVNTSTGSLRGQHLEQGLDLGCRRPCAPRPRGRRGRRAPSRRACRAASPSCGRRPARRAGSTWPPAAATRRRRAQRRIFVVGARRPGRRGTSRSAG